MTGWQWSIDGWIVLTGVLSACSCALLGNYLVLRRMSLMGDAISHAVLPGLAVAFLVADSRAPLPMFLGAVAAGALTTVLTEAVARFGKVEHGAAMGVIFSILFAVGLILIRRAADHVDLDPGCVLYGNIAQVPFDAIDGSVPPAVRNLLVVLALNALFVALFYKELKISTFDPNLATTVGIPASLMHYALMILVSLTTVANFESVGSILVIAMLIVPAVAAHLLTDGLARMILVSLLLAVASAVAGHVAATFGPGWIGIPYVTNTSAMIAVVSGALLVAAILFSPRHGVISAAWHRAALSISIAREDILGLLHRWHERPAAATRTLARRDLLAAVGDTWISRWALRRLIRAADVELVPPPIDAGVRLTARGLAKAAGLVRAHRLWETYLARHFPLPLDHLHHSAERVEHYLTPQLRAALSDDVTTRVDPSGKEIPPEAADTVSHPPAP